MIPYRVAFRRTAADPWQHRPFADRAAASAFQRERRRALWAAVVQAWSEREGRWIG